LIDPGLKSDGKIVAYRNGMAVRFGVQHMVGFFNSKPRSRSAGSRMQDSQRFDAMPGLESNDAGSGARPERRLRPYPLFTIDEAARVARIIYDLNAGHPWRPTDVAISLDMGPRTPRFYYLTAAARDYGFTIGTRDATRIELTELGRNLASTTDETSQRAIKFRAFLHVDMFRRVYEHYQGRPLPELKFIAATLTMHFGLDPTVLEEFVSIYRRSYAESVPAADRHVLTEQSGGPEPARLTEPEPDFHTNGHANGHAHSPEPVIAPDIAEEKPTTLSFSPAADTARRTAGSALDSAEEVQPAAWRAPSANDNAVVEKLPTLRSAFLAVPAIDPSDLPPGFFKEVISGLLTPALQGGGYTVVGQCPTDGLYHSDLVADIAEADLMIADVTVADASVLFCAGIRLGSRKPVVFVRASGSVGVFGRDSGMPVFEYHRNLWPSTLHDDIALLATRLGEAADGVSHILFSRTIAAS
jgi:hypothetical protein